MWEYLEFRPGSSIKRKLFRIRIPRLNLTINFFYIAFIRERFLSQKRWGKSSVANPDPQYRYVFGPLGSGSGSSSTRYGIRIRLGSGSSYNQVRTERKILIPTVFWLLYDFLSLENDVNVKKYPNRQKKLDKFIFFSCHLEGPWRK